MKGLWTLFNILFLIIIDGEALPKQVCVIGAGRAGLAVIKTVADRIGEFKPIAFERNSDVGGLWNYREKIDSDKLGLPAPASVYKNLRILTAKNFKTYPDYNQLASIDPDPYISHETILNYMKNYTDNFELRKYIQFDTVVTRVKPITDSCKPGTTRWMIKNRNLNSDKVDTTVCDAVVVCNGRFSKPNIPNLPGIEKFPGQVLHSKTYRVPERFTNKRVIVWGSGASARGIARDLTEHAKSIFISHKNSFFSQPNPLPDNVFVIKNVVSVDGSDFILEDDSKITADVFIYCTGFVYDFPFLDDSSGIAPNRHRLFPLLKNFINKEHPSMAFIGLGSDSGFPDLYYLESQEFLKSLQRQD